MEWDTFGGVPRRRPKTLTGGLPARPRSWLPSSHHHLDRIGHFWTPFWEYPMSAAQKHSLADGPPSEAMATRPSPKIGQN